MGLKTETHTGNTILKKEEKRKMDKANIDIVGNLQ